MTEEQNNDTVLEQNLDQAAQEGAEHVETTQEKSPQAPEAEASSVPETETQQVRFKTLREARKRAEQERDELKRKLEELHQGRQQEAAQPKQQEEDYSIAEDDFVEGKHLKRYDKEIKRLKGELEDYKQQSYAQSVETRLKTQYQDFDSVVNKENLEVLSTAYPEIASTLQSSPDLYSKAVSAYTMIKKFGIIETQDYSAPKQKAQQNAAKPRPLASVNAQSTGDSPLSQANAFAKGLTPELKAQLYREMIEAKKNR